MFEALLSTKPSAKSKKIVVESLSFIVNILSPGRFRLSKAFLQRYSEKHLHQIFPEFPRKKAEMLSDSYNFG